MAEPYSLFDPQAFKLHYMRASPHFTQHNFLYRHLENEIVDRLLSLKKDFSSVLNLSPWPFTSPYLQNLKSSHRQEPPSSLSPKPFDLILSCLYLHWVDNLPQLLKQIYNSLQNKGLFLGIFWGADTLHELRFSLMQAELELTGGAKPRISPFIRGEDASRLMMAAGFHSPVCEIETITVNYPDIYKLMLDLRGMGEANKLIQREKTFTKRKLFNEAGKIYSAHFATNNQLLPATFQALIMTGWR